MTIERPMFPPHAATVVDMSTRQPIPPADSSFAANEGRRRLTVVERDRTKLPATEQDWITANSMFEGWERLPAIMNELGEGWDDLGVNARLAYASATSPQEVFEEIHEDLDPVEVDVMLANLTRASEVLAFVSQCIDLVLIRHVAAASAVNARTALRAG